eukprot:GHVH01008316.1.p1 GENE.GHVH01008316.1~~GHVH01008316.1.p1  ORF type:complete len:254 (-),score=31.87 GHVH01008316.1:57-791(-)
MTTIVLGSESEQRIQILKSLGYDNVVIVKSSFKENLDKSKLAPSEYVRFTAFLKGVSIVSDALNMAPGDAFDRIRAGQYLLVADTVAHMDGEIFEKPSDEDDNRRMLRQFSGNCVRFTTSGWFMQFAEGRLKCHGATDSTRGYFRELTADDIERHIASGEGRGKAAGFAIQCDISRSFIEKLRGATSTVIGFPAERFTEAVQLHQKGILSQSIKTVMDYCKEVEQNVIKEFNQNNADHIKRLEL